MRFTFRFGKSWSVAFVILLNLWTIGGCSGRDGATENSADTTELASPIDLLNVSYDPTRELYQDFNAAFSRHWQEQSDRPA